MPHILSPRPSAHQLLQGISYEDVKPGRKPIPIVSAPRPSSAHYNLHPSLRPQQDDSLKSSFDGDCSSKRDSGYTNSSHYESTSEPNGHKPHSLRSSQSFRKSKSLRKSQSLPRFTPPVRQSPSLKTMRKLSEQNTSMESPTSQHAPKLPELALPKSNGLSSLSFDDLTMPGNMEFSNRGSLYIAGQKPVELATRSNAQIRRPIASSAAARAPLRVLSPDEETMSQRVRSMYEMGADSETGSQRLSFVAPPVIEEDSDSLPSTFLSPGGTPDCAVSSLSKRASFFREDNELAGGIEDWQDVVNEDVDRYGFIVKKALANASSNSLPEAGIHRVATSLQLAAETPRRSRSRLARTDSTSKSMRSLRLNTEATGSPLRPYSSQSTYSTARNTSIMRTATNRLPQNKNRRYVDEAGDMLTLPPDATASDNTISPKAAAISKKREWSREEKWRKMARVSQPQGVGGPTEYFFDPKDPKVISRTWKGIPDRWRATAWRSYLSASAKKLPDSSSDADLIASFNELVDQGSPDDVQIDLDVPRTISSHIMFRRRYRGGQRLLFRVLHALSLYFPDTGYVQGMAALAATFLCYFDEEMAFVMLVRLWQTRGLDRLYENGFAGLMTALKEFEDQWLASGVINTKLAELGITPTAYGTRWYLTLFNYTIPFPAQLRVWDVFLLLGDPDTVTLPKQIPDKDAASFNGSLDVLHATSAALIDGMRDILLESDFEEAMKALTSWIPIRDEDLLMRVTRAEYKVHRKRK